MDTPAIHTGRSDALYREIKDWLSVQNLTADETAALMDKTVLAIRPRFAELHKDGVIRDTGERRRNESGKSAVVWALEG